VGLEGGVWLFKYLVPMVCIHNGVDLLSTLCVRA